MRSNTLEPASPSADADFLPAVHIDLHAGDTTLIRRQMSTGADEVRLDVGLVSIYLSRKALARLLEEGKMAEDDLELMAKWDDPFPQL